ncbi:unnamed protein product [Polarella glacialis]|uniref:C2H2-type domain-containing protein n=1 Tax=Polarella glacialis TaxID=89957 RepID=A0A813DS27_POLGL|nr:unnamed protein product [Polarella glacialis]
MGRTTASATSSSSGARPASTRSVLLLGEANFSFALALVTLLEPHTASASHASPEDELKAREAAEKGLAVAAAYLGLEPTECLTARIVATCFEGSEELVEKYPEAIGILSRLQAHGPRVEVCYGVNGWDLDGTFGDERWDVIAWNHPHLGTEDFRLHRLLLAHFCAAAAGSLREGGHVVVSLVEGQERRWCLVEQASRQGLFLASAPGQFAAMDSPGYECKRNTTGRSFKNLHSQRNVAAAMRSWLYRLTLRPPGPGEGVGNWSLPPCESGKGAANPGDADPTTCRLATEGLVCSECDKSFSCAQGLKTHVRQVHELKKYGDTWKKQAAVTDQTCAECGRSFRDQEALWQHQVAAHGAGQEASAPSTAPPQARGARGPSLLCQEGQEQGKDAKGKLSMGSVYGYESCKVCGMAIPRGSSMADHLEALKPLVSLSLRCACGRPFVEQRALEQHSRFCPEAAAAAAAAPVSRQPGLKWLGNICARFCA